MVVPALVRQSAAAEQPDAGPELLVLSQARRRGAGGMCGAGAVVAAGQATANAAEASFSGGLLSIEHLFERTTEPQIGGRNDAGDFRPWPGLRLTCDPRPQRNLAN